jgi:nucleoside-diphosphate-sugar epimerase
MKILLTGASGFLGRYIAKLALRRGYLIRSLARKQCAELHALGVEERCGDLADHATVMEAVKDCDAVIHTAALAGIWGRREDFIRTNVRGTANIVDACTKLGTPHLVYTSSPSVVFDGRDLRNVDEKTPYPSQFNADYPDTKSAAEDIVLKSDSSRLRTLALRPHLLWGPGDQHIAHRLLDRTRRGYFILPGDGRNLIDAVYVENAAQAHLDALDALQLRSREVSGRAYFITNHEPVEVGHFIRKMMECYGAPPFKFINIPKSWAQSLGAAIEAYYRRLDLEKEPPLTKFVAAQLACDHYFNGQAAERDLGYKPKFTMQHAYELLQEFKGTWMAPN